MVFASRTAVARATPERISHVGIQVSGIVTGQADWFRILEYAHGSPGFVEAGVPCCLLAALGQASRRQCREEVADKEDRASLIITGCASQASPSEAS